MQFDRKLEGVSGVRPDVLAFAANAEGDLVPWLVAEIKTGPVKTPELALPALLRSRELLGTAEHYAVINGQWFRADRSLRKFELVDGPLSPTFGDHGSLADTSLATSLLLDHMWRVAASARNTNSAADYFSLPGLLENTVVPGIPTVAGEFIPVQPDVLWIARRRAVETFAERSRRLQGQLTPSVLADAIARLLGKSLRGTVLDPFCGYGNLVWAAMDRANEDGVAAEFVGFDVDSELVTLVRQVGQTAPMGATVDSADAFMAELPEADAIVAAPPFGVRRDSAWTLSDGSTARDFESAAVDLCLRQLRPGGRAVFLLPVGFTFRSATERFRNYLANEYRIGALIGLPPGCIPGTGIASVILVLDRAPAGETFVAQLGNDWMAQLSVNGAALQAALGHLDGTRVAE